MSLALILAAAVSAAQPDCASLQQSARPAIDHANADWLRELKAGDAQALAAAYADDGIFVTPEGEVVKGRASVQALYAAQGARGAEITGGGIESQGLACGGHGLVYEWGRGTVRTRGADGREVERAGAYLTVWKRVGDVWKIVRNMAF